MRYTLSVGFEHALLQSPGGEDLEHAPALLTLLVRREFQLAVNRVVIHGIFWRVESGAALDQLFHHQHEFLHFITRQVIGHRENAFDCQGRVDAVAIRTKALASGMQPTIVPLDLIIKVVFILVFKHIVLILLVVQFIVVHVVCLRTNVWDEAPLAIRRLWIRP